MTIRGLKTADWHRKVSTPELIVIRRNGKAILLFYYGMQPLSTNNADRVKILRESRENY